MPFTKGDPNINKKGRPKGAISLVDLIRAKLEDVEPTSKKSYAELLVQSILSKALKDQDHHSQKLLMNYLEGMPLQRTDVTSGGKELPTPIMSLDVLRNNSNKENIDAPKKD